LKELAITYGVIQDKQRQDEADEPPEVDATGAGGAIEADARAGELSWWKEQFPDEDEETLIEWSRLTSE
jgi:hypothetical protein